jgi:hypothetical protein
VRQEGPLLESAHLEDREGNGKIILRGNYGDRL